MAMKNYAKQLNTQIEEVVAEVRENLQRGCLVLSSYFL